MSRRSPLTLAALATSAVPGLDVTHAAPLGGTGGEVDSALLSTRDGRTLTIRVPRTAAAESEQSADLVAILIAGEYEDAIDGNIGWSEGDWNFDGGFNTQDFVAALELGTYRPA